MFSNKQIRSEIMEIIDNNSKNIPEGVYLELCDKLQKFNFSSEKKNQDEDDILLEAEVILERRAEREHRQFMAAHNARYITNPVTGREVLRTGRIGRALARQ